MSAKKGAVIWITGLPGSGKSTLAAGLVQLMQQGGIASLWLDGDDLRSVMTPAATYSRSERDVFYATLGHLGRLAATGGVTAVISATADRRTYRDSVRQVVPRFVEVWLRCASEELARRHPDRLYGKAQNGELKNLPGYDSPYEEPTAAEVTIDSDSVDRGPALRLLAVRLRELLDLEIGLDSKGP